VAADILPVAATGRYLADPGLLGSFGGEAEGAPVKVVIAHSPDSDDAFMHFAIGEGKVDTGEYQFEHEMADIETLNRHAVEGRHEVTAISIHAYAHLADKYALLNHGASMGEGYGPVLITRDPRSREDLEDCIIAVPGEWTSAALALKLWMPHAITQVVPFDEIMQRIDSGEFEAGVIIHEGQVTYEEEGYHKVVDLGDWWATTQDGLPLPLGGNAIRRDLGEEHIREISRILRESIAYALEHREEALNYAEQYNRGLTREQTDRFVGMYVNQRTLDYGEDGREAVCRFLRMGAGTGVVPEIPEPEFIT
jgi:1,4-dihydroxy-6-naphthoate synthase